MEELTIEKLESIRNGEIIAQGVVSNSPKGVFITQEYKGRELLWVAKKGHGYNDWAIYIHWADYGLDYVLTNGDKVMNPSNIQKLVPCSKEVLAKYRY